MLRTGQVFKDLQTFYEAIKKHEKTYHGAFEILNLPDDLKRITFKCSACVKDRRKNGRPPAFISAKQTKDDHFLITCCALKHLHLRKRLKNPSFSTSESDSDSDSDFDSDSKKLTAKNDLKTKKSDFIETTKKLNPSKLCFKRSRNGNVVKLKNFNELASSKSDSVETRMKQVPRQISATKKLGTTNFSLSNYLIFNQNQYHCPFCAEFWSYSYRIAEMHVKTVHENGMIKGPKGDTFFIPCYAYCRADLGNAGLKARWAHYHCNCGLILQSKKSLYKHTSLDLCNDLKDHKQTDEAMNFDFSDVLNTPPSLTKSKSNIFGQTGFDDDDDLLPALDQFDKDYLNNSLLACFNDDDEDFYPYSDSDRDPDNAKRAKIQNEKGLDEILMTSSSANNNNSNDSPQINKNEDTQKTDSEKNQWPRMCRICHVSVESKRQLIDHVTECHPSSRLVFPANLFCPLCDAKLDLVENLANHYRKAHSKFFGNRCSVQVANFSNPENFYQWKAKLEIDTFANYSKKRRTFSDDDVTLFFACSSGWADNRASLKDKKTERHCPAFIKARQNYIDGTINVYFCNFHYGHELNKEMFWKKIRKSLHGLMSFRQKAKNGDGPPPEETGPTLKVPKSGPPNANGQPKNSQMGVNTMTNGRKNGPFQGQPQQCQGLDQSMALYWEIMCKHLADSDDYSLSIEGRWANNEAFSDPDDKLCRICRVEFKNRKTMLRHMLRIHNPKRATNQHSKYSRPVRCLFCNMEMAPPAMKNLIQHYINAHEQQILLKMRLFNHVTEFEKWRLAVTGYLFRRHKVYRSSKGDNRQYWTCKFTGKLQNPSAGVTEGHCPAWIFAQSLPTGAVQVSYCLFHIGHELPLNKLPAIDALNENTSGNPNDQNRGPSPTIGPQQPVHINLDFDNNSNNSCHVIINNDESRGAQILLNDKFVGVESTNFTNHSFQLLANSSDQQACFSLSKPSDFDHSLSMDHTDSNIAAMVTVDDGPKSSSPDQQAPPFTGGPQISTDQLQTPGPSRGSCPLTDDDLECLPVVTFVQNSNEPAAGAALTPAALRHQVTVLLRPATGSVKLVKISLSNFPLVTNEDGKKYYAVDERSLVEAVSQTLGKQGEQLFEGDQLEILEWKICCTF